MDDGSQLGVVIGGVAHLGAEDVEVLVVHDAHQALVAGQVLDLDLADHHRAMEIDDVVAVEGNLQVFVLQRDGSRQRVAEIALADRPAIIAGPKKARFLAAGKIAIDAESARARPGVVFLADMREEDVADLVLAVVGDQKAAIADGDVAGHGILSRVYTARCAERTCGTRGALKEVIGNWNEKAPPLAKVAMGLCTVRSCV